LKAEEQQSHFAALDNARITLYKAQDRPRSEYIDSIHAASLVFGGNDPTTFERYLTAILCHESFDKNENWPTGSRLNQYAWRSRTNPNEYCNPLEAGNDWGLGQINARWNPEGHTHYDPVTGQSLWSSVDQQAFKYNPFYNIKLAAALLKRELRYQEYRQDLFGGISEDEKWWNAVVLYHRWRLAIFYANIEDWEKISEDDQNEMIRYLWGVLLWLDKPCY
jgi:hypothetical protein